VQSVLPVRKLDVLLYSQSFMGRIEELRKLGYHVKSANVNYVLYWRKEGAGEDIKIILPEISFEKGVRT